MILYANETIQELLSLVDLNGCHLKKWLPDMSEIVDTTEQDKAAELDQMRLAAINDHKIHLWKLVEGVVVQKTQEELAAEELSWRESNFNFDFLMGYLYEEMEASSVIKLSQFSGTISSMIAWTNYKGIKELLMALVSQSIATQAEADIVTAGFAAQGIVLGDYI